MEAFVTAHMAQMGLSAPRSAQFSEVMHMCPFMAANWSARRATLQLMKQQQRRRAGAGVQMLFKEDAKEPYASALDRALAHLRSEQQTPRPEHAAPSVCPLSGAQLSPDEAKHSFAVDVSKLATSSEENLRGFIKARGSLVPMEEETFFFTGNIYAVVEGQRQKLLFKFDGYNIARMVPVEGGWRMLTREVGIYKDPVTNEIIKSTWRNPLTDEDNEVVHVWNDPVNQQFLLKTDRGEWGVPTSTVDGDVFWNAEVFLKYASPLPRAEFPEHSASDMYESSELFQFYTKVEDLENRDMPSAPCNISWVRISQWLPWMQMGSRPGQLLYHCRGKKLMNGFNDIPQDIKDYLVEMRRFEFFSAPAEMERPNETTWTYFKKMLMQKGAPRADGTVAKASPKHSQHPRESIQSANELGAEDRLAATMQSATSSAAALRRFTRQSLAEYDGSDLSKPILLSVAGRVYDVSTGRHHYRKGETYNCLTGRDSTLAFATGNLRIYEQADQAFMGAAELDLLSEAKKADVQNWVAFFDKEYKLVGELVDF
ncbi:Neuferricin-like [Porphyridium purpureum]|uniref:Neuferricin-like n=1 Tax=Porphyridium purpureum TaxID=35688 RepID=A0A5J4Z0L5_PORPP|nr:Neuferricin-like [Porphyridium purpureum]|eukprot:POR8845..scf208_2